MLPNNRSDALSLVLNRASKIKLLREGGHFDIADKFAANLQDDIEASEHAAVLRLAVATVV